MISSLSWLAHLKQLFGNKIRKRVEFWPLISLKIALFGRFFTYCVLCELMLFLTLELLSSGDVGDVLKWKHMGNDFLSKILKQKIQKGMYYYICQQRERGCIKRRAKDRRRVPAFVQNLLLYLVYLCVGKIRGHNLEHHITHELTHSSEIRGFCLMK